MPKHLNVSEVAKPYEKKIQQALIKAFNQIKSRAKVKELESILSTYGIESAMQYINQLNIEGIIDQNITDEINEAVSHSGRMSFQFVPDGAVVDSTFRFNLLSFNASQFVRNYELSLIKDIGVNTRNAIRQSLQTDILAGVNPLTTARNFRSAIGLTARQEQAVRNFETMLREGNRDIFNRALRDKRFDSTIARAFDEGKALPASKIKAMTKRYREKYLKYRSETIARTESLRAVSIGQHMAIMQAVEEGNINRGELKRVWIFVHDAKTRHSHRTINSLNPEGVEVDQPFQTELGPLMYPRDPNGTGANTINCRCAVAFQMKDDVEEAEAGWTNARNMDDLNDQYSKMDLGYMEFDKKYSNAQKLSIGNKLGSHMSTLLNKYPGVGKTLGKQALFTTSLKKATSLYHPKGNALGIYDKRFFEIEIAGSLPKVDRLTKFAGSVHSASNDFFSTYRHELGHHLKNRLDPSQMKRFSDLWQTGGKEYFKSNVGRYAGTNMSEAFSETFSGYTSPLYGTRANRTFPKELEDVMRDLLEG